MSLQIRLGDLVVAIGTDIKLIKTWITGSSTGTLTGLTTTNKTSLVAAINEVKAGNSGAPPTASTTVQGIVELATLAEVAAGTDTTRVVTVDGVRQERTALKNEILGGVGAAYDTLQELSAQMAADENGVTTLTQTVGNKIDATAVGNTETDLVAAYAAAKA